MINVEVARRQMIEQQIRTSEVLDLRVLDALSAVPRERFVPEAYRDLAFADTEIALPCGQSMLSPRLDGRILQSLSLQPTDCALEIGTGSGFFAACLDQLAARVLSVEIVPELAATATTRLRELGAYKVTVSLGDGMALVSPAARPAAFAAAFDVIALTGSLPLYDARFESSLSLGGRLFAIVGAGPMMEAVLVTRIGANEWLRTSLFETWAPALLHAPTPPRFVF